MAGDSLPYLAKPLVLGDGVALGLSGVVNSTVVNIRVIGLCMGSGEFPEAESLRYTLQEVPQSVFLLRHVVPMHPHRCWITENHCQFESQICERQE